LGRSAILALEGVQPEDLADFRDPDDHVLTLVELPQV
jgi:hypothetical protein